MAKPKATPQAENEQGTDSSVTAKRKSVSKRNFIDSQDKEVDAIELATGMQYLLLDPAGDHTFNVQLGEAGKLTTMAAIFGLQTKIGNVANTVLNDEEPGTPTDAAKAIKEWLAQVNGGTWAERTTGGVGARIDKDALASAIVAVGIANGKVEAANEAATYTIVRDRLESGWKERNLTADQYTRQTRQVPEVAREYATRVGKAAKSVGDLI